MKKFFKIVAIVIMALVSSTVLSACFGNESKAKLEIFKTFDSEYLMGEQVNTAGGVLKYTDKNGNVDLIDITADMIVDFDTSTYGHKTLTISYEGLRVTTNYKVYNLRLGVYLYTKIMTGGSDTIPFRVGIGQPYKYDAFIINDDFTIDCVNYSPATVQYFTYGFNDLNAYITIDNTKYSLIHIDDEFAFEIVNGSGIYSVFEYQKTISEIY